MIGFIVSCVALGLEYIHKRGIIHRDIKPENLMIDEYGYVRLTDLGIARTITEDTKGDNSGTLGYMSLEVLCKEKHGIAVDYFALGIIAYEIVTGKVRN